MQKPNSTFERIAIKSFEDICSQLLALSIEISKLKLDKWGAALKQKKRTYAKLKFLLGNTYRQL